MAGPALSVPAYTVAAMFLRELGAPVTPAMQRAVAIWLRFESGGTITGNNPWNLHNGPACSSSTRYCPGAGSLPGQVGNRYAGPGDKNVAVFATLQDGVRASAKNLIRLSGSYGYGRVISEARSGDAFGFLVALQNSSWSAGHYGYAKLVNAFRSSLNYNTNMRLLGPATSPAPDPGKTIEFPFRSIVLKFTNVTGGTTFGDGLATLYALAILDVPEFVHLITGSDKLLTGDAWTAARDRVRTTAATYNGKPVSALPETIKVNFTAAETAESDAKGPLDAIAEAFAGVGNVFAFLLDVENWLYIMAMTGGVVLTAYGFAKLAGANPSMPRPAVVSVPTPAPVAAVTTATRARTRDTTH